MRSSPIRPTTLLGIKSYASDLKKSLGLGHIAALQQAAEAAGYQNLSHAKAALASPATVLAPRHITIITCHWKDRKTKNTGTEGLAVDLATPLWDIATVEQMKKDPLLSDFFVYDKKQLVADAIRSSQDSARQTINQVARVLQFMDATGLRPSRSHRRIYPGNTSQNRIPGADHTRAWFDPATRAFLMTDEPYDFAIERRVNERAQWADRHKYQVLKAKWQGMYAPDVGSRLYLVGNVTQSIALGKMLAAIDKLPDAFCGDNWLGVSLATAGLVIPDNQLNAPVRAS
ncbi:hypothetical protein RQP54_06805 [Curvibacter sp. APW13]|uniref:hypothetical protein n=1 Tax=Curvibacter sp. APW13 TaxID=3077236 RepID=UPI0028DF292D|nr:hypothetical protein [Curvibacter sp. APW13]MDT8990573.1 hypothetical protein [Curvibacter sp. APW13]